MDNLTNCINTRIRNQTLFANNINDPFTIAFRGNNPKYAHLTDDDVQKVEQAVNHSYDWLEQARGKLQSAPKHLAPPVTVAQIRQERNSFESTVQPILNKPPPKAPSPPKEKNAGDKTEEQPQNGEQQQNHEKAAKPEENMEWSST